MGLSCLKRPVSTPDSLGVEFIKSKFNILTILKGKPMEKRLLAVLFFCMTVCLLVAPGYTAELKIGIIDTNKIINDSKAGKTANVAFNKEFETRQATLAAKQKEVLAIQDELAAKGKDMTSTAYSDKTAAYSKASKEFTRLKSEMEEELKAKKTSLSNKLLSEITAIISDYCKKEKYTVILEKSYVAAYDGGVEITDKIIQLYDASKEAPKDSGK
jgi:outer membrane protein